MPASPRYGPPSPWALVALAAIAASCIQAPATSLVGSGSGDTEAPPSSLRIEPASPEITVDLDSPSAITFRLIEDKGGGREIAVTDQATWELSGAELGTLAPGTFTSDGRTGGLATIAATFDGRRTTASIAVHIRSRRLIGGVSTEAPAWFDAAKDAAYNAAIEPGDGAVLPRNLRLDVDFGALDTDDVHEIALTRPYLDVRIYAPGVAGPRHVELSLAESDAVGCTSRGEAARLAVRSLQASAHDVARAAAVSLAIADRGLTDSLLYGAEPAGFLAPNTGLWRYRAGSGAAPWYVMADRTDGMCVGCHVAIARDGTRVATSQRHGANHWGYLVDVATRTQVSTPDPGILWQTATFDPGGRLLSSWNGVLTVRDGTTLAPIATLSTNELASEPTISPDGKNMAYAVNASEIHVRSWDAATTALGPAQTVVPIRAGGGGVKLPSFSPDGSYIVYSTTATTTGFKPFGGAAVVASHGSADPLVVSSDAHDNVARWASSIASTRAGGRDAEPMAWISMSSSRAIGVSNHDQVPQLWLFPFCPARGTCGRPFHLPGQPPDVAVRHAAELIQAQP